LDAMGCFYASKKASQGQVLMVFCSGICFIEKGSNKFLQNTATHDMNYCCKEEKFDGDGLWSGGWCLIQFKYLLSFTDHSVLKNFLCMKKKHES
jgi:hypothetical protein